MSRRTIAIAAALSVLALGSPLVIASANPLADNLFNSGVDKYKQGDYQGAIADFTKALEINPQYTNAYANRGVSKYFLGDLKGACDDWRKAADLGDERSAEWVKEQC